MLFLLALVLMVPAKIRLVGAITTFTVAHSITLVAVTLGWIALTPEPIEAMIVFSIMLLAAEIIRHPWLATYVFGLLHGFGFSGALREIGLPANAIPESLLYFNLGVETGQIIFVLSVIGLYTLAQNIVRSAKKHGQTSDQDLRPTASHTLRQNPSWIEQSILPAYAIGTVASFWMVQRVMAFWN